MNTFFNIVVIFLLIKVLMDLTDIKFDLRRIRKLLKQKKKIYEIKFFTVKDGTINKGVNMLELTKTQKQTIAVKAFDNSEPPVEAPLENVVFESLDESICTVVQDAENPLQAVVFGVADGVAQIRVTADANLGEGESLIEGLLSVEVQSVIGTRLGVEAVGAPEEQ